MQGTTKGNQSPPVQSPICACGCGQRVKRSENRFATPACQWVKRPKPTLFKIKVKVVGKNPNRVAAAKARWATVEEQRAELKRLHQRFLSSRNTLQSE